MKLTTIFFIFFILTSCKETIHKEMVVAKNNPYAKQPDTITANVDTTNTTNAGYQSKLLSTKQFYPFNRWRESYKVGLTQYTKENCDKTRKIFDDLIASLIQIGENATAEQKKGLFKNAIIKTNQLNEEIDGLIETGEREDLCALTNKITIACGLDPHKYGDGEGLASEWRNW